MSKVPGALSSANMQHANPRKEIQHLNAHTTSFLTTQKNYLLIKYFVIADFVTWCIIKNLVKFLKR